MSENKWRVRIDPFGEAGYRVKKLTSGPNANLWYVEDAWWYFKGTSQLNRSVFPNSTQYTLWTSSQARSCELANKGRSSNFWEFNRYCRPQSNFQNFIAAAWDHEWEHYRNGRGALLEPKNQLYVKVEGLVRRTQHEVIDPLTTFHKDIQERLRMASGIESIFGNRQGNVWVWINQTQNHVTKITLSI